MDDVSVAAAWLRQRPDETDQAWLVRLDGFFGAVARERAEPTIDDPKAERVMDRAWRRFKARLSASAEPRADDI